MKLAQTAIKTMFVVSSLCIAHSAALAEDLIDQVEGVYLIPSANPGKKDASNPYVRTDGKLKDCLVIRKSGKNRAEVYMEHNQIMGSCNLEPGTLYLEGNRLRYRGGDIEENYVEPKGGIDGSVPKIKPGLALYMNIGDKQLNFTDVGGATKNVCGIRADISAVAFTRTVKTLPWKDGKTPKKELMDYCPK